MASPEGSPRQPTLYFVGSKDWAILIRSVPIVKDDGCAYNRLFMAIPEKLKFRYQINEDKCIKSQPDQKHILFDLTSGKACYVQDYKAAYFDYDGMNPEDPTIAVMCNFDGTESGSIDINRLKLEDLKRANDELKAQNDALHIKIMELQDALVVMRDREKDVNES